MRGTVVF